MEGPTNEQIDAWKAQYGPIYQVEEFIFRGVTLGESSRIFKSKMSSAEKEEELVRTAVLWPADFDLDYMPAGIVSSIADEIRSASGAGDPKVAKALLDGFRERNETSIDHIMKALIIAAMPAYTDEQLDEYTFPKLLEKVALAESILRIHKDTALGSDMSLDLVDPEEEAEKEERMATHHNALRKPGQAAYGDPIAEKLKQALR